MSNSGHREQIRRCEGYFLALRGADVLLGGNLLVGPGSTLHCAQEWHGRGGCLRHLRSRLRSGFAQRILSCVSVVANLSQSGCAVLFFLQTTFSVFLFEICISFIGRASPSVQFTHGELVYSQVLKPSPVRLRKEPSPRPSASATRPPRGLPAPHQGSPSLPWPPARPPPPDWPVLGASQKRERSAVCGSPHVASRSRRLTQVSASCRRR
ncbi:uncharacterized protein LOC116575237 [Mustela erminea]|uniref:uncharacterized protein LOC116575237 n=1 Tax=Mustela erminea TaxID=36723 RepID=UPI0013867DB6|nr:uncharacterized protein LOC116575237 [Mustela erminea]